MPIQSLILVVLFPLAIVLIAIEYRIMNKPPSQRSARQQKFIDADLRAGAAYRKGAMKVLPPLVAVLSVIMILIAIPLWSIARLVPLCIAFTVGGGIFLAAAVVATVWLRSSAGRRWVDETNQRAMTAANQGRPIWFINGKAGIFCGCFFLVIGVAVLIDQLLVSRQTIGLVLPAILVVIGALALVAGVAQRRRETSDAHRAHP